MWRQLALLFCQAKGGPRQANAIRTVLPPLEGSEESDSVYGAGRGHGHSSDWLVRWLESASSTFWFQLVWVLCACGQHIVNFFHLVGVLVSARQLKGHGSLRILSIWGRTESPWLCLMAELLLFCLAWLFSFCINSFLLLNLFFD